MKKIIIILIVGIGLIAGFIYFLNHSLTEKEISIAGEKPAMIGFSMGTTREERWFKDRDFFIERAQKLGAVVNVTLSDYDAEKQNLQIESLISQGVKVIIVIPADSEKIAPAIKEANQAGIKIIAYDRLIKDSNIDSYISFNNVKVGELEAQSVLSVVDKGNFAYIGGSPTDNNASLLKEGTMNILKPKIENGDINLVIDQFMTDWKPEEAYKTIKNYLQSGGKLDAVIAANDGTASGVIQALQEFGLAGKIPVSGQDAELSATQRIVAGTQTSTVYKPINSLAYMAAEIAVAMANGTTPTTMNFIDNGKVQVPSFFLEPIIVDKNNMDDTIIKDGFHTYEEVYQSVIKQ
ncbi:MAG: substrate-binding domain-containing protein [Patescibacteria group bacterium]|jgi:D-xylose transport system substrate-binding protein